MNNFSSYEFITYFIGTIEMIYFFNKLMLPKNKKIRYKFIYFIIVTLLYYISSKFNLTVIFNMKYNSGVFLLILMNNIITLLYPAFFRKGTVSEKLFLGSFYIYMITLLTVLTITLYSTILNITFMDVMINRDYKLAILIKSIHFIFIIIISKYGKFTRYIDNKSLYTKSITLLSKQIILFTVIRYTVVYSIGTIEGLNIITLFLLLIEIISTYNMDIFSKYMRNKFIIVEELNYKKYEEHITNMYQEMRAWRHDLHNHINVVLGLLELDEKNKAIEYISDIESRTNKFEAYVYTDNIVIDSLLSNKINIAKEKNIKLNLKIKMNSVVKIPNVDICTIIGNLMDNSIEACEMFKGHKFIDMTIISESNQLIIKVKNSSDGMLKKKKGQFISTKQEYGHGFGLVQIDGVVKKFNGYINREYNENVFNTYIRIEYK